jgi:uracil-DNA glycosylase
LPVPMDRKTELEVYAKEAKECKKCGLWKTRKNVVFGAGSPSSRILFVGEAPGYNEDIRGVPFCGKAGEVLDILLDSISLKREDIYITNIIKCRPPNNRDPEREEVEACSHYLERQIEIIEPVVICCLGRHALRYILERYSFSERGSITALHGRVLENSEDIFNSVRVIALYHPAVAVYDPGKIELLKKDFQVLKDFKDG